METTELTSKQQRDRLILAYRRTGVTLGEVADLIGMTREAVRQAEAREMARERADLNGEGED
jgi:DNA-directed RNA polymerase sigma subunit (sigma70/sigma32)